jgi:arylsulfatase A-like enzyme
MFVDPGLEPITLVVNDTESGVGGIPSYQELPGHRDYNYYVSQYDGEIRYFDEHFKRLIMTIKELGLYDTSLIIFTSDHGEDMGERNYYFTHGESVFNSLIRVPLIVRMGSDLKGVRKEPSQILDLVPTMLDVAGIVPGAEYRGSSLLGKIPPERAIFSEMPGKFALIRDDLKLIYHDDASGYKLFDLAGDPDETRDLVRDSEYGQRVKLMAGELSEIRKEDFLRGRVRQKKPRLSREEKEKLKALGYVQ